MPALTSPSSKLSTAMLESEQARAGAPPMLPDTTHAMSTASATAVLPVPGGPCTRVRALVAAAAAARCCDGLRERLRRRSASARAAMAAGPPPPSLAQRKRSTSPPAPLERAHSAAARVALGWPPAEGTSGTRGGGGRPRWAERAASCASYKASNASSCRLYATRFANRSTRHSPPRATVSAAVLAESHLTTRGIPSTTSASSSPPPPCPACPCPAGPCPAGPACGGGGAGRSHVVVPVGAWW
mmetsp:Transcript_12038/g.38651  ORF Transcript_12038/g.38651 Transcript_12038/m.38651 type:complete len:243 (+) Transcript_12038:1130-1858(+)